MKAPLSWNKEISKTEVERLLHFFWRGVIISQDHFSRKIFFYVLSSEKSVIHLLKQGEKLTRRRHTKSAMLTDFLKAIKDISIRSSCLEGWGGHWLWPVVCIVTSEVLVCFEVIVTPGPAMLLPDFPSLGLSPCVPTSKLLSCTH